MRKKASLPPVYGIIPSGGGSSRFGGSKSKLLSSIAGRPAIQWTVQSLLMSIPFEAIFIPCPKESMEEFRFLTEMSSAVKLIEGGACRAESVKNGFSLIPAKQESLVLVHDGARCAIEKDQVVKVLEKASESGVATLALPVTDTIKHYSNNQRLKTINRDELWAMQTPQVFRRSVLEKGYQEAKDLASITDEIMLVEEFAPVSLVHGSKLNIKLTTPEDKIILEAILKDRTV